MNRGDLPSRPSECVALAPEATGGHSRFLSKSKYLWGLQCHKLLWHAYNAKHPMRGPDAQQQAIFDQGHEVGQLARQLIPGGIEVAGASDDYDAILAASKQALKQRRPLYEASFTFSGGYVRADILNPAGKDQWDIFEVKSRTSVKDVHLHDLAFQAFVLDRAGLKIRRCTLAHINVVEQRIHHQVTGEPMKFLTLCDWTGMVETELFAATYRSYGLATVRYPVLEIVATVEPFENGRGFSLRVHRASRPRIADQKKTGYPNRTFRTNAKSAIKPKEHLGGVH